MKWLKQPNLVLFHDLFYDLFRFLGILLSDAKVETSSKGEGKGTNQAQILQDFVVCELSLPIFFTPIPRSYTSSPLDGVARN